LNSFKLGSFNKVIYGTYERFLIGRRKILQIKNAFQKLWLLVPVLYSFRLYYTAESNLQLGNRGDAIAILNEIIEFYSGTEAAVMAQALIDRTNDS